MSKRQTWDIYAEMLTQAVDPATKTRIQYRSNLSYNLLMKHLSTLLEKGLIKVTVNPYTLFQTTKEGKEWLKRYKHLTELETKTRKTPLPSIEVRCAA